MEEQYDKELLEEMRIQQEEQSEDIQDDQFELSKEMQEAYGAPEPEEIMNQHSFIHKAAFGSSDTVRTTFLGESELGRPLFNVRFLLDLHDISGYYLDPILIQLGLNPQIDNRIANYFWEKIQNITSSGMSNRGFAMNLNVTRKMDTTRKRVREESLQNLKGGKK